MIDYLNDQRIILILSLLRRMQTNDLDTEDKKKKFVYDLALLNSLATKGYRVQRTPTDNMIYDLKQIVCEFIATAWPSRCTYHSSCCEHESVLYIYVNKRQYSFHVDLSPEIKVKNAKYGEWDEIVGGWQMSDEEYHQTLADATRQKIEQEKIENKEYVMKRRQCAAQYLAQARKYIRIRNYYLNHRDEVEARFWKELAAVLPWRKQKNKCFVSKDLMACFERYFSLVQSYFSQAEKSIFCGYPSFHDDRWIERMSRTYYRGISFTTESVIYKNLESVIREIDNGTLTRERLFNITNY